MPKCKANARLLIENKFSLNGLKCYGKPMKYKDLFPGDLGLVVELHKWSKERYPGKTHWFKPKDWKYTWHFAVEEGVDFEFLNKKE